MKKEEEGYILYACAGCSKAGQVAYRIAIDLDGRGKAEMSCLAGIASHKPSFVRKIRNKKIAVIDGCPIECAKTVLQNQGLKTDKHFQLKQYGIKKNELPTNKQIEMVVVQIAEALVQTRICSFALE